jgi:ubiquinone/menaquinone biosynthesis C-methylase UbiE
MIEDDLSLLVDPLTHDKLLLAKEKSYDGAEIEWLTNEKNGKRYPVKDGIPVFLDNTNVTGFNLKYQRLYDRYAKIYDLGDRMLFFIKGIFKKADWRKNFIGRLHAKDGDKVLEVSIGTGGNIRYLPRSCKIYGLDISWGMLQRCKRNILKWGYSYQLFQGNAEMLPFADNIFDIVYHIGGINFFNDKESAIKEMIRVAKPGTLIMIADETDKTIKISSYIPISGKFYKGTKSLAKPPVELIPKQMQDIRLDYHLGGFLYFLSFKKPPL